MSNEEKQLLEYLIKLREKEEQENADAASIVKGVFDGENVVEAEAKFSETENGALAYKTSGKVFVDFIFNLSSFRKAQGLDLADLTDRFLKCYKENAELAWKMLFFVGDIRGGAGERKAFFECFYTLIRKAQQEQTREMSNEIACMLQFIPEYSRWDILIKLFDAVETTGNNFVIYDRAVKMLRKQNQLDMQNMIAGRPISLMAKWMPSINATSYATKMLARRVMTEICQYPNNPSGEKCYRKMLSALRSNLKVVEKSMTANEWSEIDYSAVPSKAAMNLRNAFRTHDSKRYDEYIYNVSIGRDKINATVTEPHEVISKIVVYDDYKTVKAARIKDPTLIQIWDNLGSIADTSNTIVVADTSGSMTDTCSGKTTCLDVSLALAIFTAERLTGPFHNKFITFSSEPKFITIPEGDIYDKIDGIPCDMRNTNIEAVFHLLARAYATGNVRNAEMPKNVLILSDMQFDAARDVDETREVLFDTIKRNWKIVTGNRVQMPKLIFWNLDSRVHNTIPLTEDENGLILMSGFSKNLLSMALSGQFDPFQALIEILNSKRYEKIGYEYTCSGYDNVI